MAPNLQVPSLGRVVHYILPDSSPRRGEHRAAIITSVHGGDCTNLHIFYDQDNDVAPVNLDVTAANFNDHAWSVSRDDTAGTYGTWHFPEYVAPLSTPAAASSTPPSYVAPAPAPASPEPTAVEGVTPTDAAIAADDALLAIAEPTVTDTNEHGIGPDVGTGPNPDYVPETTDVAAGQNLPA